MYWLISAGPLDKLKRSSRNGTKVLPVIGEAQLVRAAWLWQMPKSFVQEDKAGGLGTTDVLPDLFQVLAMERDEIAEQLDVAGLVRRCRFLAINPSLDIDAPFLRVLSAEKCLVDIFPLSSDLDSPRA